MTVRTRLWAVGLALLTASLALPWSLRGDTLDPLQWAEVVAANLDDLKTRVAAL